MKEDSKLSFDDGKFEPGDEVASITIAPFAGDRGDVAASMNWKNGKWTVVMSRKLVTGGKYDVQFEKLDATYESSRVRQRASAPRVSCRLA